MISCAVAPSRLFALLAMLGLVACRSGAPGVPDVAHWDLGGVPGTAGAPLTSGAGGVGGGGGAEVPGGEAGIQGVAVDTSYPFDAPDCTAPTAEATCTDGWCEIPAGCFVMGSPPDEWGHPAYQEEQVAVTLTRSFLMQQTEVTVGQWTAAGLPIPTSSTGAPLSCTEPNCPVANVTWFDVLTYANLLSGQHDPPLTPCYRLQACINEPQGGLYCQAETTTPTVYDCEGFRLPTDAEWEYAARAGTTSALYSGPITAYGDWVRNFSTCRPDPNLEEIGWFCWNSGGAAHPIRGLAPNAFGLYDMAGNVDEWNNDRHDGVGAPTPIDPDGKVDNHPTRNTRGGMFDGWSSFCRMASQGGASWEASYPDLGFRLVRTLTREEAP